MTITPSEQPPVAVFDMDGVLVHGDVFGSFVRHRLRRSPAHLVAVAGAWPWLVGPIVWSSTRRRAVSQLLRIALAGLDDAAYEAAATAFAFELGSHPSRVVHQAVEAIGELQAAGYRIVVSTACEQRMAAAYISGLGLEDVLVIGSLLEFRRAGLRSVRSNHGADKVSGLIAAGIGAPWAVAYSDALSDVPLLAGADRAVLVNPDEWLRTRVRRRLGRLADEVHWPERRLRGVAEADLTGA